MINHKCYKKLTDMSMNLMILYFSVNLKLMIISQKAETLSKWAKVLQVNVFSNTENDT